MELVGGTHISGIITSKEDNDFGTIRIVPEIRTMSVKILRHNAHEKHHSTETSVLFKRDT